jgi:hypothetical protein
MVAIHHLPDGQQPPAEGDWLMVEGLKSGGYTVRWRLSGIEEAADWPNGHPSTLSSAISGGSAMADRLGVDTIFVTWPRGPEGHKAPKH